MDLRYTRSMEIDLFDISLRDKIHKGISRRAIRVSNTAYSSYRGGNGHYEQAI